MSVYAVCVCGDVCVCVITRTKSLMCDDLERCDVSNTVVDCIS